uniref:Uncharacterized protein n=1 Tax=Triticum urartu TaxID=4572 RepID=A0A8R7QFU5_TRIUA
MYSKCLAVPTLASSTSRMGRCRCGRLSILVRLMSRNANADSTLNSTEVPSRSWASTMLVLNGRSVRGMMGSRASITNRVTFPASSCTPSASTWRPYSSAARADAMAAVSRSACAAMCSAAPAVSSKASRATLRPMRVSVCSHCASACGCEITRANSSRRTPGSASRQWWTGSCTSPTMWSRCRRSRS